MKYKIKLGGRGADIWIQNLNDEQRQVLQEGRVETDQMEYDEIAKVLNKDNVDDSDETYTGVYDDIKTIVLEVYDESDNLIFDSTTIENWYFDLDTLDEHDVYESVYEEGNYLFVESYSKGTFFEFELETDNFDVNKLSPKKLEINERFDLINGLLYDGVELDFEFGDYWGKGYYYHLS